MPGATTDPIYPLRRPVPLGEQASRSSMRDRQFCCPVAVLGITRYPLTRDP